MHKTRTSVLTIALVASTLAITSCDKKSDDKVATDSTAAAAAPAAVKSGTGKGIVISIDSSRTNVNLSHNDIPGIMEAMAMDYHVEKASLLDHVAVGDSVNFTLSEPQPGEFSVTAIAVIPKK